MKKKTFKYLLKYELLNNLYNGYSFFFGVLFPLFMLHILSFALTKKIPVSAQTEVNTQLFLGMSMLLPLAAVFLSYAASYSNELEKDIPSRLNLYGLSQKTLFTAKLAANFIFLTAGLIIYVLFSFPFIKIAAPTVGAVVIWLFMLYLLASILLVLAHGIANLIRKFGITYGIVMALYFATMILSGLMGLDVKDLPGFLKPLSKMLPSTHIGNYYIDYWMGRSYNFGPIISAFIFTGSICIITLLISFKVRGRKK